MVANGYLDTSVQKAFLPNIPGCLEQYEKLCAVIQEAHRRHRSLTICWLDLANAYGSVHHQLIKFALKHYHSPPSFLNVVSALYSDLEATVTCRSWSTTAIPLKVGVYQGDPLSVIIFNTVMATLADALKADKHLGYTFSNSSLQVDQFNTLSNYIILFHFTCIPYILILSYLAIKLLIIHCLQGYYKAKLFVISCHTTVARETH